MILIYLVFPIILMVTGQILGSTTMTPQQANTFMNLVGLPLNTTMINVYRATRDGFSTSVFKSLVNGINGTYTIIKTKNGYIFGAFTKINFGLNVGWVGDPSTFIFSIVNPSNYPCIMYQKNNASLYTVYTGGNFHMGGGPDIHIVDSSDVNALSTGHVVSFQLPSNYSSVGNVFLTGYANFQSADVEVYISKKKFLILDNLSISTNLIRDTKILDQINFYRIHQILTKCTVV